MTAVWNKDCHTVAEYVDEMHMETSILTYNNENALACALALAFYSAREYYLSFRELPTGKGFTDIVYIPRKEYADKPAMITELKWNQSVQGAISQITEKQYVKSLENYSGKILLIGINYDLKTKNTNVSSKNTSVHNAKNRAESPPQ